MPAHQPEFSGLVVIPQNTIRLRIRIKKRENLPESISLIFKCHADLRLRITERGADDPFAFRGVNKYFLVMPPIMR